MNFKIDLRVTRVLSVTVCDTKMVLYNINDIDII